jgi:hypothetical protein
VIARRIWSADYQMTTGVDSRDLPRLEPLNDIQRPQVERFLPRERHLVKKNTELCPLLEKTFASTCLVGSGSLNPGSEGYPNAKCSRRLSTSEINGRAVSSRDKKLGQARVPPT